MADNRYTAKIRAKRIELEYFKHLHPFRRWKLILSIVVPLIAGVWLIAYASRGDQRICHVAVGCGLLIGMQAYRGILFYRFDSSIGLDTFQGLIVAVIAGGLDQIYRRISNLPNRLRSVRVIHGLNRVAAL